MTRTKYFLIPFVFSSVMAFSQQGTVTHEAGHANGMPNENGCVLSTASNGQVITVHGKATQEPHDLAFDIPGCKETVLLTYAGDRDNNVSGDQLHRDENLKRFQKYTSSVYKSTKKNICIQCSKYGDVEATLTGKLEIATIPPGTTKDHVGFLRDQSGKIVGKWGWGHPVPFAAHRLVIQSVSDVKARKLSKPDHKQDCSKGRRGEIRSGGCQRQPARPNPGRPTETLKSLPLRSAAAERHGLGESQPTKEGRHETLA